MHKTMLILLLSACGAMTYPHTGSNPFAAGGGGSCSYSYATHDGEPVVTSARCDISTADLNTGTEPSTTARAYVRKLGGHDGCDNDDAGHILANRLGGKAEPTNLFPQSPHLNRGAWEEFERAIADCFANGAKSASLKWSFDYSSSSRQRPTSASYSVSYDSGASCAPAQQSFSNACDSDVGGGRVALRAAAVANSTNSTTVGLDITCVGAAGCVTHDHATGAYAVAGSGIGDGHGAVTLSVGKQLDVVHLSQASSSAAYIAPATWCIGEKTHVTASGNLVLVAGVLNASGAAAGATLDCTSRSADLDVGDCTVLSLAARSSEHLRVCYTGKV